MNLRTVRVVRLYVKESSREIHRLLEELRDEWQVSGVTVYRGIAGFGEPGKIRTVGLLEMSHDLPIVVEFYDSPDRIDEVLKGLTRIKPQHLLTWLTDTATGE